MSSEFVKGFQRLALPVSSRSQVHDCASAASAERFVVDKFRTKDAPTSPGKFVAVCEFRVRSTIALLQHLLEDL